MNMPTRSEAYMQEIIQDKIVRLKTFVEEIPTQGAETRRSGDKRRPVCTNQGTS